MRDPYAKSLSDPMFRQKKKPSKREIRAERRNKAVLKQALFEIAIEKEKREEREGYKAHNQSLRYPR